MPATIRAHELVELSSITIWTHHVPNAIIFIEFCVVDFNTIFFDYSIIFHVQQEELWPLHSKIATLLPASICDMAELMFYNKIK